MANYGKDVRKLLLEAGCHVARQAKGDHELWWSPITERKITVDKKIKSRHTANGILKRAGLEKKF